MSFAGTVVPNGYVPLCLVLVVPLTGVSTVPFSFISVATVGRQLGMVGCFQLCKSSTVSTLIW